MQKNIREGPCSENNIGTIDTQSHDGGKNAILMTNRVKKTLRGRLLQGKPIRSLTIERKFDPHVEQQVPTAWAPRRKAIGKLK